MEPSILNSTKHILGLQEDYNAFDLDVLTHINAAFSTLSQLGIASADGYFVEDATDLWTDLNLPQNQLNLIKTYIFLKVRILFDPPTTSFLIEATDKQIKELEWRLNVYREEALAEEVS